MEQLFGSLHPIQLFGVIFAVGLALGFEFVNGFHDTANAVATVIYTHSLRPWVAVVWSGIWNLIGVLTSTGAVAFGVIALLPTELVMDVGSAAGFAMVFSLLISAILWNLGTWYLGLPASSSHTLIGSIMGVGLMNSYLRSHNFIEGINWGKARDVGMSLLVSPIVGFVCTALLFLLVKMLVRKPELYTAPDPHKPPPLWIRGILCLTCTGVSFAHGSNDGQKGMGLLMLILVGIIPGTYALDMSTKPESLAALSALSQSASASLKTDTPTPAMDDTNAVQTLKQYLKTDGVYSETVYAALATENNEIATNIVNHNSLNELPESQRNALRREIFLTAATIGKLDKTKKLSSARQGSLVSYRKALDKMTQFIPVWVKFAVALALGFGTMIGWKRIVVTVGEKIGKSHLTYAQGASAEVVAMVTIGLADRYGLPVSTTHVLSSGVAGSMAANRSGLQMGTLRNLLLAWVLTLPVCIFLGATLFASGLLLTSHLFGVR
jgi:PiT family inorganic phosphate transporter